MTLPYRTKDYGQLVEMVYHRQDPGDRVGYDSGHVIRRIDAVVGGEHAGYLKISYVPSNRLSEVFPTLWHWARKCHGWGLDLDDPVELWIRAHLHASRCPISRPNVGPWSLTRAMAPDPETMQADLDALEDRGMVRENYRAWCRDQVDRPHVDYIRVFLPWQRLGIGTALLDAGARWMADTYGLFLSASTIQSDEAKALWAAVQESGEYPVERRRVPWGKQEVPVMDYR
jgi:GNAT superfamily N-acetyltransferase